MNCLYYGDNLEILRKYIKNESVDLCYIDPPFNSKRNYNQIYNNIGKEDTAQAQAFIDTWEWNSLAEEGFAQIIDNHLGKFTSQTINLIVGLSNVLDKGSLLAYLISLTLRIVEIHRVLKSTGSFYLHCDPTSSHYLKLVLDAIFCSQGGNFINEIIWKRTTAHSDSKACGNTHDILFFYTKSKNFGWNKQYQPYDDSYVESHYRRVSADGRIYRTGDLTAMGLSGGGYTYNWKGVTKLWRLPEQKMQELHDQGKVHYTRTGTAEFIRYLDEMPGTPLQDVWDDISPINSQAQERLGYPTQKPEALLERIIKASSNEGDVVLDGYCGCGTTVAVAQRLNRQWIGIDITYQSISLILRRVEKAFGSKAADEVKLNGIPKDIASAVALANCNDDRTRKEFEKWAILTYSKNRATINQKKGADRGIDGFAFFLEEGQGHRKIVLQVKSGNVSSRDIRDLYGTMTRENAAMAVFITLKTPTSATVKEANACGVYQHKVMGRNYPCVQIITIKEILEDSKCLDIPLSLEVLKSAQKQVNSEQLNIFTNNMDNVEVG